MERVQHDLAQGSPEWHAFRAEHFGASEAPAMLGLSSYMSREELLRLKKTGVAREVDPDTQRRFADGHATEEAARPIAEGIIGEELYPQVWSYGRLSASTDGMTMDGVIAFEHKLFNSTLASAVITHELPDEYMAQCQQIMLVTGADWVLFMVSDGTKGNCARMFVKPRPAWFDRIRAGWAQFALDLESYQPVEVIPAAVAAPVKALPALSIQVQGSISLVDNLSVFGRQLESFIAGIPTKPETDQDFADCEAAIKTLQTAQNALEAEEKRALAQTATIDEMRRTVALYRDQSRNSRLMLEKLVKSRKEQIRFEIVHRGKTALTEHLAQLDARLGKPFMPKIEADFAGVIKGKGGGKDPIKSLRNAVDTELARAKIEANAVADKIHVNLNTLRDLAKDWGTLFADTRTIVLKDPEDLTALVKARIADHKAAEEKRLEAEREKIRAEEQAKARREQEAIAERERQERAREEKRLMDEALARRVEEERLARTAAPQAGVNSGPGVIPAPAAAKPMMTMKASGQIMPREAEIVEAVATVFRVDTDTARGWLRTLYERQVA